MKSKICIILGTRPEIIKMSPVIRECQKRKLDFFILHTNQHYSKNLDRIFFEELNLPKPKYNLKIGSGSHSQQIGKMLIKMEKILIQERPEIVLIEGDTNSVLSGALAASKLNIKVGHIEAGLRSYFNEMPEEINRILTDHCSNFLFAPTENSKSILLKEGIKNNKIFITGNTIVDAIAHDLNLSDKNSKILDKVNVKEGEYFLLTIHRQENVNDKQRLKGILNGMDLIFKKFNLPIIFPIHPRTKNRIDEFKFKVPSGVNMIEPVGYFDFLHLENNAKLIFTDSGGVQEESCILGIPCVTLRDNTERPETMEVKSNILAGADSLKILRSAVKILRENRKWKNPFGKGDSAKKIIDVVLNGL